MATPGRRPPSIFGQSVDKLRDAVDTVFREANAGAEYARSDSAAPASQAAQYGEVDVLSLTRRPAGPHETAAAFADRTGLHKVAAALDRVDRIADGLVANAEEQRAALLLKMDGYSPATVEIFCHEEPPLPRASAPSVKGSKRR